MTFGGYEKDRETLKYKCPVLSYGMTCAGMEHCRHCRKSIRIPMALNRRIFTPIARSSYKWDREYKYRSAIERVNGRIEVGFGFKHHFIRGQRKMRLRLSLALLVMLAMAVGQVKAGRKFELHFKIEQLKTGYNANASMECFVLTPDALQVTIK